MSSKPTISLCMIAKNEEEWIAQAIKSVAPIVSEVILVDTGSTDRTVAIAKELGAQIHYFEWNDDFSAPRNVSLQRASGDWILVLDADEAIAERDHQRILRMAADPSICWEFLQRHYSHDQRLSDFQPLRGEYPEWEKGQGGYFESNCVRMFPNHDGIEYRGRIHELVEFSISDLGKHKIVRTPVRIHHYGHTRQVLQKKNKHGLYAPLGERKIGDEPINWKAYYELGVEYNSRGCHAESIKAFKRSLELNPHYLDTWVNLGYVECAAGLHQDAERTLKEALRRDPNSAEAWCNLGVVYLRVGNLPIAEQVFRRALLLNRFYVNALCNLGVTLAAQGRLAESAHSYHRALDFFPGCTTANADLGMLYFQVGEFSPAERYLTRARDAEPETSKLHLQLGELYIAMRRNSEAAQALQDFCALEEKKPENQASPEMQRFLEKLRLKREHLLRPPTDPQMTFEI